MSTSLSPWLTGLAARLARHIERVAPVRLASLLERLTLLIEEHAQFFQKLISY